MTSQDSAVMNMAAFIAANHNNIQAAVVAFALKPTEGNPNPPAEILTIGDDAVHIFGLGELVKMQLFQKLEGEK